MNTFENERSRNRELADAWRGEPTGRRVGRSPAPYLALVYHARSPAVTSGENSGKPIPVTPLPAPCEGCDIVQSDHAPQAGVAQVIFHGDLIRRRGGHQVELEEEQDEEVERRVRRDHSRDKTQVRMHG